MLLIPAIDLKDGQCVRLRQGDMNDDTVFSDDPVAMAGRWVEAGTRRLHIVDLSCDLAEHIDHVVYSIENFQTSLFQFSQLIKSH